MFTRIHWSRLTAPRGYNGRIPSRAPSSAQGARIPGASSSSRPAPARLWPAVRGSRLWPAGFPYPGQPKCPVQHQRVTSPLVDRAHRKPRYMWQSRCVGHRFAISTGPFDVDLRLAQIRSRAVGPLHILLQSLCSFREGPSGCPISICSSRVVATSIRTVQNCAEQYVTRLLFSPRETGQYNFLRGRLRRTVPSSAPGPAQ
jgi:hypothetical protein